MTEVGGTAAIYIDPGNEARAADVIVRSLAVPNRWQAAGLESAKRFSREAMIGGRARCYRMVIRQHSMP